MAGGFLTNRWLSRLGWLALLGLAAVASIGVFRSSNWAVQAWTNEELEKFLDRNLRPDWGEVKTERWMRNQGFPTYAWRWPNEDKTIAYRQTLDARNKGVDPSEVGSVLVSHTYVRGYKSYKADLYFYFDKQDHLIMYSIEPVSDR